MVRVYSLLIIGRSHSNTFLLIDLQKKNLSKVKYYSKGYVLLIPEFWQVQTGCCPLINVYFNDKQINSKNFKNTSGRLLLKFVEYLFLESFFVSLDKSVLLHHNVYVKIIWNFDTVVQKNIFCFFIRFCMKLFPIAVVSIL